MDKKLMEGIHQRYMKKYGLAEVTYIEVDYGDLETLVQDVYNIEDFCIPSSEEASNSTSLTYHISEEAKNTEWCEWDKGKWESFMNGKDPGGITGLVLERLVKDNVLPVGSYLINIFW